MTKIQDNKISFIISASGNDQQYALKSGEFSIKDHRITPNQPNEIKNGDTVYFNANGELNFRMGRKRSKEVAAWFNSQCDPYSNTTFGHPAGKLNFAMIGTLRLKIAAVPFNDEFDIEFKEILLAQGLASGSSNNWWFGGKNCFYTQHHQVTSNGRTANENHFRFIFSRGSSLSSNVHTVKMVKIEFLTWMNMIDDNKLLSQMNIPGTHDSGTSNFKLPIFSDYATTQDLSILEQLNFGIRFLDIRCRHVHGAFKIYHDRVYCNLMFDDVMQQCISFLRENPSECIVMMIKEEYKRQGYEREFYETFLHYVNLYGSNWWYCHNNAIPRLKDVRKKIVLMHRFDFKEHSFGINVTEWADNQTFIIKNTANYNTTALWIQDQYSVSKKKKAIAIKKLVEESNKRENYWYLNYISLAPSFLITIINTSNFTNAVIDDIAKNTKIGFLGLIIMDYPNWKNGLTSTIINNNRFFQYHLYPGNSLCEIDKI